MSKMRFGAVSSVPGAICRAGTFYANCVLVFAASLKMFCSGLSTTSNGLVTASSHSGLTYSGIRQCSRCASPEWPIGWKLSLDTLPLVSRPLFFAAPRCRANECPLWVSNGHYGRLDQCPLFSRKRTFAPTIRMSASCQKRTFCAAVKKLVIRSPRRRGRAVKAGR
jgi:hypothetical protein